MPLAPGPHFLTPTLPVYVMQAQEPGPCALIQAGIHGDEIAGVHALAELLEEGFAPDRGRLLICPLMNPPAYRARQRERPGGADLNRSFPGDPHATSPELRLANQFMELIGDERPDLMATLHESHKRYDPQSTPSFGQTIVYGVDPAPEIVGRTIERLNAELLSDDERWDPQYYPVATSSTEVIVESFGCTGLCIETWMGFAEARRIQMQRRVVQLLLEDIGVRTGGSGS